MDRRVRKEQPSHHVATHRAAKLRAVAEAHADHTAAITIVRKRRLTGRHQEPWIESKAELSKARRGRVRLEKCLQRSVPALRSRVQHHTPLQLESDVHSQFVPEPRRGYDDDARDTLLDWRDTK